MIPLYLLRTLKTNRLSIHCLIGSDLFCVVFKPWSSCSTAVICGHKIGQKVIGTNKKEHLPMEQHMDYAFTTPISWLFTHVSWLEH